MSVSMYPPLSGACQSNIAKQGRIRHSNQPASAMVQRCCSNVYSEVQCRPGKRRIAIFASIEQCLTATHSHSVQMRMLQTDTGGCCMIPMRSLLVRRARAEMMDWGRQVECFNHRNRRIHRQLYGKAVRRVRLEGGRSR